MLKRVNIKFSEELYNWMKEESSRDCIPMSALVVFAVKNYRQQQAVTEKMGTMEELMQKLSELEKK